MLLIGLLFPIAGAAGLCALASIWPLRLDARALQDVARVQSLGLPTHSGVFVFLSSDNSIESARTATFGLRQLAFPEGSVFWGALKEQCDDVWSAGFVAVDSAGSGFTISGGAQGSFQWRPVEQGLDDVRQLAARGFVIYDSHSTRDSFEKRWPFLRAGERVAVLSDATALSAFKLRRPASEFTFTRLWRLAAVLGSFVAVFLLLNQLFTQQRPDGWMIVAGSVFVALGLNLSLTYLFQSAAPALVHWSPVILWSIPLLGAVARSRNGSAGSGLGLRLSLPSVRAARLALIYCGVAYAVLFLVRLDFDGDFYTNWLPQGRFHYLLGRHDPTVIIGQGSMQAASYPPGYGIALSRLMWVSGMNPSESFLAGPESSFAILIYRLFIFSLNAALLLLIAMHLRVLGNRENGVWLGAIAITMLLIPSTAGKHIASETLLFPIMAAAVLLITAGRHSGAHLLTGMGLAVGGMATLIKWEATLLFTFAVAPWLVTVSLPSIARATKDVLIKWSAALALCLMPVVVWKLTLKVHNEFFVPMTWSRFVSSLHLLPGLAAHAARGMLDDGRLLALLLALPGATLFRLWKAPHLSNIAVPTGIAALLAGFILVFLFANMHPQTYLDTSYSRLVMLPTFGAILYCAETVQISSFERGAWGKA